MDWYATLHKSPLNPPSWVFGPVWTVLYCLIAFSLFIYLKHKPSTLGILYFVIHMLLNFAWAPLFFVFHSPVGSFIDIIFMCITLLLVFYEWKKRSPLAVYTLIPYSLWILFATYLNYTILVLN